GRTRALDRDERGLGGAIGEGDVLRQVLPYMRLVLLDVRGVHDHEHVVHCGAVRDDVVDDGAALVAEKSVPRFPDTEACDVARDEPIDRCERMCAIEVEL